MFETVTVEEAISRGKRRLKYIPMAIGIGGMILCGVLAATMRWSAWLVVPGILASWLLAWFYWSIQAPAWRIWAFNNVRNVHQLKRIAIRQQLIWPDDSAFNKTEWRNAADRAALSALEEKFRQPDSFTDDLAVPEQTEIFYSRSKLQMGIALGALFILGASVPFFVTANNSINKYLPLVFFGGFGLFFIISNIRKLQDTSPQLVIGPDGIRIGSNPLHGWVDIRDEMVVRERSGKSHIDVLTYQFHGRKQSMSISPLDIDETRLMRLLEVYRGRYHQKQRGY